jgi:hypothetical protein
VLCAAAERLTLHFFQPARFQHDEKRETTLGLDQVELKLRWLRLNPSLLIMRFGARASSVGEKIKSLCALCVSVLRLEKE